MPQDAAQAGAPETASQCPLARFRVSRRPDMRLTSPPKPSCVFADPRRLVPRAVGPASEAVGTSREVLGTGRRGIRGRRERLPRFHLEVPYCPPSCSAASVSAYRRTNPKSYSSTLQNPCQRAACQHLRIEMLLSAWNNLRQLAAIAVLATGAAKATAGEVADRFWALLFDGPQGTAATFPKYFLVSDEAILGGRRLFGTPNPVRALENTLRGAAPAAAHLFMAVFSPPPGPGSVRSLD